jgi:hypothetical protein
MKRGGENDEEEGGGRTRRRRRIKSKMDKGKNTSSKLSIIICLSDSVA